MKSSLFRVGFGGSLSLTKKIKKIAHCTELNRGQKSDKVLAPVAQRAAVVREAAHEHKVVIRRALSGWVTCHCFPALNLGRCYRCYIYAVEVESKQ